MKNIIRLLMLCMTMLFLAGYAAAQTSGCGSAQGGG